METALTSLIQRFDNPRLQASNVIHWGSPVPSFGDVSVAKVATLGLNPSNLEFVDKAGKELDGSARRFHSLNSLGLTKWSEATIHDLKLIADSCRNYFVRNPYDGWFKGLDQIISGTKTSYYHANRPACHLDLIPYATICKWTELSLEQQSSLLNLSGDILGLLLKDSPIEILILNGRSVVRHFEKLSSTTLNRTLKPTWTLPRKSGLNVPGYAYAGIIHQLAGIKLNREILVLGYNHNIQSSFGVTTHVKTEIRHWITKSVRGMLSER